MAKRIVLNLDLCCGCRSCEAACFAAFGGEARIKHGDLDTTAYLPLACKHCKEALCTAACPVKAIEKDEKSGVVRRAAFICTGCQSCVWSCPFGVIDSPLVRHISQKCSLCEDREQGPRCVAACSSGALQFLSDEETAGRLEIGARFVSKDAFMRRKA